MAWRSFEIFWGMQFAWGQAVLYSSTLASEAIMGHLRPWMALAACGCQWHPMAAIGLPLELYARTYEASLSSGHGEVLAGDMSARWWANMGEHG